MFNSHEEILKFLNEGKYISQLDEFKRPAIYSIEAKILKEHFDHCITTNLNQKVICFDFENLIASSDDDPSEIHTIQFMSNSKDLRHLIKHPLMRSFIFLKWNQLAFLLFFNLFLYVLLSVSFMIFIVPIDKHPLTIGISGSLCIICLFCLLFFEKISNIKHKYSVDTALNIAIRRLPRFISYLMVSYLIFNFRVDAW